MEYMCQLPCTTDTEYQTLTGFNLLSRNINKIQKEREKEGRREGEQGRGRERERQRGRTNFQTPDTRQRRMIPARQETKECPTIATAVLIFHPEGREREPRWSLVDSLSLADRAVEFWRPRYL